MQKNTNFTSVLHDFKWGTEHFCSLPVCLYATNISLHFCLLTVDLDLCSESLQSVRHNLRRWLKSLPALILLCSVLCINYIVVVFYMRCQTRHKQIKCWYIFPILRPCSLLWSFSFCFPFFWRGEANIFVPSDFPLLCKFPHVHSDGFSDLPPGIRCHLSPYIGAMIIIPYWGNDCYSHW